MGAVIKGDYPISLSRWVFNSERFNVLDLVTVTEDTRELVLTPQNEKIDVGLFVRPFTADAWVTILTFILGLAFIQLVPRTMMPQFEETGSFKIGSTAIWYFFVLINAYFGGALTMFLASEVSVPFESIREVMRSYPTWKLWMHSGGCGHINI